MIAPAHIPKVRVAVAETVAATLRSCRRTRRSFSILRFDSDGRPELYAQTSLVSEIERFEDLGYIVEPDTISTTN